MRVGVISLLHESNTFLPELTGFAAFERDHVLTGDAIPAFFAGGHHEVTGLFEGLGDARIEAVPIFAARAVPSGTIAAPAADRLMNLLTRALDGAGDVDGLLVALHGAAVAEQYHDFDGHILTMLRRALGPHRPIIGTLDPHANLSSAMVMASDALVAYRTNPHIDQRERGHEAAQLMARTLRGEVRPTQAAVLPPVAIGIEAQNTSLMPARQIYDRAARCCDRAGVLSISVMLGFPYADVPEMGSGFVVVTDSDLDAARRVAMELGTSLWEDRAAFAAGAVNPEAALKEVCAHRPDGPVGLLDMGDNVGGGSPGDGTLLAHGLLRRGALRACICLCDGPAVEEARRAGPGARRWMRIGGQSGGQPAPPLEVEVTVVSLHAGRFEETRPRHGGMTHFDMGPTAVVKTDSGLTLLLTTQRVMPVSLAQLSSCGLEPSDFDAIVLKGVHAPVAAYAPICARMIMVDTPGVTACNLHTFDYRNRRRPLYPFERDATCSLDDQLVIGHCADQPGSARQ